jgi:hypothetical protein
MKAAKSRRKSKRKYQYRNGVGERNENGEKYGENEMAKAALAAKAMAAKAANRNNQSAKTASAMAAAETAAKRK